MTREKKPKYKKGELKMKSKVISYRLGDVLRKEYEKGNKKPNDIGTKPVPKWLQDKNVKDEIEKLFTTKNEGKDIQIKELFKQNKIEQLDNRNKIEKLFTEVDKQNKRNHLKKENIMELEQTAVNIIVKLRKQQKFEEDCLIKALRSIPEKYAKQLLKKYIELSEAGCVGIRDNNDDKDTYKGTKDKMNDTEYKNNKETKNGDTEK
jgi:hypothetical protein